MWLVMMLNIKTGFALKTNISFKKYRSAEKWIGRQDLPNGYEYIITLKNEES